MTMRFTGKTALVTGATSGVGAAIARRLVDEGAQVAFCGFADDPAAHVDALGGFERAHYIAADLRQPDDCAALVDATLSAFGRIDILVNNAASVARGTLESTTAPDFDTMIALNLRAPFLLMQRALPTWKAQFAASGTGGVVVNIGSVNAYVGAPELLAYSASKGGLMTLSRNLANALAPWRVRVHVLNIGWTLTDGEKIVQQRQGAPADWAERAGATRPWGRLLHPADIAAAVTFLASDEAQVFSGAAFDFEQLPLGTH